MTTPARRANVARQAHRRGSWRRPGGVRFATMGWTMLYLFVFLKLPIVAACLLIWWAVRQTPEYEDDGGGPGLRRPHPVPKMPHAPRRGPNSEQALPAPPRVRTVVARAREPLR